jgi:hypothetical protein
VQRLMLQEAAGVRWDEEALNDAPMKLVIDCTA